MLFTQHVLIKCLLVGLTGLRQFWWMVSGRVQTRTRAVGSSSWPPSDPPDPPITPLEVRLEEVNGDEGKSFVGTTAEAMPRE